MSSTVAPGVLRRSFANAGRLFAGGGAAAVLALLAAAVAARTLGSEGYGLLALVHAWCLLVAAIFRFNAAPAVVRHATPLVTAGRAPELARLVVLLVAVDLAAALLALAAAAAGVLLLLPRLGWPQEAVTIARWYVLVTAALLSATPLALLRLLGRFDLVAWHRPVLPAVRLAGGLAVASYGGGVPAMAAVWFASHVAESALAWLWALRELGRRRLLARPCGRVRFAGLGRDLVALNLGGTLGLLSTRAVVVLVGTLLDAVAAGRFQLAAQIAGALERVAAMVGRALEPEIARLRLEGAGTRLRRLVLRATGLHLLASLPVVVLLLPLAPGLLALVGGDGFAEAADLLRLLLVRQWLAGAALAAPVLLVLAGRADRLLRIGALARGLELALLAFLLPWLGLVGAGLAALAAGASETVLQLRAVRPFLPVRRGGAGEVARGAS